MATASNLLMDMGEFLQCSSCLDQDKEPISLPCLHRYCSDCLEQFLDTSRTAVNCPECGKEFAVPNEGVEGFKQTTSPKEEKEKKEGKDIEKCIGCSRIIKAKAFCFRCDDYICSDCYEFHMSNNMIKDHRPHILSMEDLESALITLEKTLPDAPNCLIHPDNTCTLCCVTCSDKPICAACTLGEHENHDFKDYIGPPSEERKKLKEQLAPLFSGVGKTIHTMYKKENVSANEETARESVVKYNDAAKTTDTENKETGLQRAENKNPEHSPEKQKLLEAEMKRIQDKLDQLFADDDIEAEVRAVESNENVTRKMKDRTRRQTRNLMKKEMEANKTSTKSKARRGSKKNARKFASNKTEKNSDDEGMTKNNFPMAGGATARDGFHLVLDKRVKIEGFKAWSILSITCTGNGTIVVSKGKRHTSTSNLTVMGMEGRIRKYKMLRGNSSNSSFRVCAAYQQFKVASICEPNEIGMYDTRDGSYVKKNLDDIIPGWPADQGLSGIAADEANQLIVTGYQNSVHIFDEQLNYVRMMRLPSQVTLPEAIAVSANGHLVICDYNSKKAYAVSTAGVLKYEYVKPPVKGCPRMPFRACSDKQGYIYILWGGVDASVAIEAGSRETLCILAQYNNDSGDITATRWIDTDSIGITIMQTDQGQKALLATLSTGNLYIYDLINA